jgi:hypothetical protein
MTGPISKNLLPNTVTIFNVFKAESTGKIAAARTVLTNVRVDVKESVEIFPVGATARSQTVLIADWRTTEAEDGNGKAKTFMAGEFWVGLPDADKQFYWTFRLQDWLYVRWGETEARCGEFLPEFREQDFKRDNGLKTLSRVVPALDFDGSIHHWEVVYD